jgi:hypothetical protein
MKNEVQRYLKEIGSRGGKAGTGKAKRRGDAEHYKRMTEARERKRRACPDAPNA